MGVPNKVKQPTEAQIMSEEEISALYRDGYIIGKEAGIKEVVKWGNEPCPHDLKRLQEYGILRTPLLKSTCFECWQDLLNQWGIEP